MRCVNPMNICLCGKLDFESWFHGQGWCCSLKCRELDEEIDAAGGIGYNMSKDLFEKLIFNSKTDTHKEWYIEKMNRYCKV